MNKEYSIDLDEQLKLLLQEYREGEITTKQLLKLVDMACRDHMENIGFDQEKKR